MQADINALALAAGCEPEDIRTTAKTLEGLHVTGNIVWLASKRLYSDLLAELDLQRAMRQAAEQRRR